MERIFEHLNLRWNPFSEPSDQERHSLFVGDIQALASRMTDGVALQFVGDHGRGKSSRLRALQHSTGAPYIRLRDQRTIPVAERLLIDEAELLLWRPWWKLRRCRAIAISTHRDLTAGLWLMGFTVETVRVEGTSADTLGQIFSRRIEWARRGPGAVPAVSAETIDRLVATHRDNVRAMESDLYVLFQSLQELRDV